MNENNEINELQKRLENLSEKQAVFLREIKLLRKDIQVLKANQPIGIPEKEMEIPTAKTIERAETFEMPKFEVTETYIDETEKIIPETRFKKAESLFDTQNLEKFIGENLISKIGILIVIIGVVIGAKYSIEHNLISPLTRIILGYLVGLGLLGFGIKLKAKYENYSAVLVSGAIAIMYFVTFAAYDFYHLIPQLMAFVLMVLFTIFTVIAALNYDKQVIAFIGLVGAYAVPFFLSNGSGDMLTFFTYVTIINVGILVIAFRKYWKLIYYAAFGITWLIYLSWFVMSYDSKEYFGVAIGFATVFFILFYATFLAYKLIRKENFEVKNASILLLNSFIFFGMGYVILDNYNSIFKDYLGLFALVNAVVHFSVSTVIYRQKLYNKSLLFLVLGLVLVFITIAIPIQLDGNWVTLLWVFEAALLFWIGRTKQVPFYEKMAVPLMVLAFFSIVQDWGMNYSAYYFENPESKIRPIFNIHFLTSVLFVLSFGFIYYFNKNKKFTFPFLDKNTWASIYNYVVPSIFLVSLFITFYVEIGNYFHQLYEGSRLEIPVDNEAYSDRYYNTDWLSFSRVWLIIYTMIFTTILSFIHKEKIKNEQLSFINLIINTIVIVLFLTVGIYELGELQDSYFSTQTPDYYTQSRFHIVIKYLSFGVLGGLLFASYRFIQQEFINKKIQIPFDLLLHISILWIITSEFIAWMKVAEMSKSGEFGISIIWGVYALIIIGLGIWKKKKHLRIGAIALFAITLYKVFAYDISHFNTISKTIVLVALGVLLLIISFLYNKYKHIIFEEENV
jgi:uncharacterized membrane protein